MDKHTEIFIKIARYVEQSMQAMATKGKIDISSLAPLINNILLELETTACITIVNQDKAKSCMYAFQVLSKGFELLLVETSKIERTDDVKSKIEFATSQAQAIHNILLEYTSGEREDKVIILLTGDGVRVV